MTKTKPNFAAFVIVVTLLLLLDQITKWWIRGHVDQQTSITVIPRVFDITHVPNDGIAFGFLPGKGVWLTPLAALVAVLAGAGYLRSAPGERLFRAAMVLLAAGALGNLIDRLFNGGKVTDFIDIKIIHVFNIADACITLAAALLIVHWLSEIKGHPGPEKTAK